MYTNSITKPTSNTHQCIAVIGTVCICDNLIPMTWSTHLWPIFSYTQILLTSRIRCCQTQYNIGTLNKYVFPLEGNTTSEVITCSECNTNMSYISVLYLYID